MKPFVVTSILAPTDLSESSVPALRYARIFADRFTAKLTVMYTDPIVYPVDYLVPMVGSFVAATPEHQQNLRAEVEKQAAFVMDGRPYDIEVTVGQPIPAILETAKERNADLIIVGTHLRHGWRRALLGSVSDGVLHGSSCPVLTVAKQDRSVNGTPYTVTNIVCPVNFTPVAREAVHVAARLAAAFGARLTVVHVVESGEVAGAAADEEKLRRWAGEELKDVPLRELVLRGGAAERVLDCAEDLNADLLVAGAQHKHFRDVTVIGTTTERLLRFAPCPVLVVPREVGGRRGKGMAKEEPALAEVSP